MNEQMISIMFDAPGVQAIGTYEREKVYQVEANEAQRLIDVKGFKRVDDFAAAPVKEEE